ncbi:DHH family phosphoesterase [Candidatus Uhrbacteria bacterium]|nr:DHH family phosphoesterase [Candidatus Uhrbacteria bacterium]
MQKIIVTSYEGSDADGFGCLMAYAEFLKKQGKDATPAVFGEPHEEVLFLLRTFDIGIPYAEVIDPGASVVLVDTSDPASVPFVRPERVIEIIDHRPVHHADKFPNATAQIERVGAAATLVAERMRAADVPPTEQSAKLLACGIISNTLHFRSPLTTERDRSAFAWLQTAAQLPEGFAWEMFRAKSDFSGGKLEKAVKGDFKDLVLGGRAIGLGQIEMIGAEALVAARLPELLGYLDEAKRERGCDHVLLSILDLAEERNYLVTQDPLLKELYARIYSTFFQGDIALTDRLVLRKEVTPALKALLEQGGEGA